jgi:two-component system nitrogen regulation response regulator GlnG
MAQDRKLLIIDDETDVQYSFKRLLEKDPIQIATAANREEGLKALKKEKPDVIVMDVRLGRENGLEILQEIRQINPKQIIVIMTAYGSGQTAIEAMKLGAFDYMLKPFDIAQLRDLLNRAFEAAAAMNEKVALPSPLNPEDFKTGIVGVSPAMQQVYKLIGQVASTDTTVLITGESGTGKELVARAIYSNSSRSNNIFITINCAAIPENLLESELFGHEKGSFTGAVTQRVGKFEQCDGGTLFLDEIGEMPLSLQSKLLRVLQDGEFTRVGGNKSIHTSVRIIAATNRDLWQACQRKEFREDLYFRLNVVNIHLPPLRERMTDLPNLVSYFINKWHSRNKSGPDKISEEALRALQNNRWSGNVRELENCLQRAMVLASGDTITVSDLALAGSSSLAAPDALPASAVPAAPPAAASAASGAVTALDQAFDILFAHAKQDTKFSLLPSVEREVIARALQETNGNQVRAAKLLGITRATLRKRVERFGIQRRMEVH